MGPGGTCLAHHAGQSKCEWLLQWAESWGTSSQMDQEGKGRQEHKGRLLPTLPQLYLL